MPTTKKRAAKKRALAPKGIQLTAKQMAAAKKCLETSGKVRFGFKDVTVTRLPKSIAPVLVFVD